MLRDAEDELGKTEDESVARGEELDLVADNVKEKEKIETDGGKPNGERKAPTYLKD